MLNLKQLKKLMQQSVEKRVVIVDEEDTYVMIRLDEYQNLLENNDFYGNETQLSEEPDMIDNDDFHAIDREAPSIEPTSKEQYDRILSVSEPVVNTPKYFNGQVNSFNEKTSNISEIRYEELAEDYTEEPI